MDIWVARSPENTQRIAAALSAFGFAGVDAAMFLAENQMVRMGVPPLRLELLTSISGLEFGECYAKRHTIDVGGIVLQMIDLGVKPNKRAAGRHKDLADLEELNRLE